MAFFGYKPPSERAMDWSKQQSNVPQVNFGGAPSMPAFQSQLGEGGMMPQQYQVQDNLNRSGLEKMRGIATGSGPSAWAQARGKQLETDQTRGLENAAALGQSSQAQARGQLSRRGGMSGGARERLAQSGAKQDMMGRQGVLAGGQQAREGLAVEDERRRSQMLQQLPGAELGAAQFGQGTDRFNIQSALKEKGAERNYNMQKYQADAQAWAAQKQAEAIRAGKSKGFLEQAGSLGGAMGGGGGMGMMGF